MLEVVNKYSIVMNKYLLFTVAMLAFIACGNKTANSSNLQDSTAVADSVSGVGSSDLWSEDAVESQVRKMYARLNDMDKRGIVSISLLDKEFCTGYFNGLKQNIEKHDANAMGDNRFYGDEEGYRWMHGKMPLTIESVKVELLTGNMANATVHFATKNGGSNEITLEMWLENGQWRVNNFIDTKAFGKNGFIGMMERYARDNNIPFEAGEESAEGSTPSTADYDVSVRTTDLDSEKPRYEAIIRINGKTVQVAEGYTEGYPQDMLKSFGNVWQADVNFDGYDDVLISLGLEPVSDQVFKLYDAWIYNPNDGKFHKSPTFRDIYNPEIDAKKKRILSHYVARDGHTKVYSAHYWQRDGSIQEVGDSWTK